MRRIVFSLLSLLLAGASPAFAEGFTQPPFASLVVVNLVLGAVLTLFLGALASVQLRKLRAAKLVELRMVEHRSRI